MKVGLMVSKAPQQIFTGTPVFLGRMFFCGVAIAAGAMPTLAPASESGTSKPSDSYQEAGSAAKPKRYFFPHFALPSYSESFSVRENRTMPTPRLRETADNGLARFSEGRATESGVQDAAQRLQRLKATISAEAQKAQLRSVMGVHADERDNRVLVATTSRYAETLETWLETLNIDRDRVQLVYEWDLSPGSPIEVVCYSDCDQP